MDKVKEISTLMSTSCSLNKDEGGKSIMKSKYLDMTVSLLYLTLSCLDIMFVICICVRFQANLKESHLIMLKPFMGYIISTSQIGL